METHEGVVCPSRHEPFVFVFCFCFCFLGVVVVFSKSSNKQYQSFRHNHICSITSLPCFALLCSIWRAAVGAGYVRHVSIPGGGAITGVRAAGDGLPHELPRGLPPSSLRPHATLLGVGASQQTDLWKCLQHPQLHVRYQ